MRTVVIAALLVGLALGRAQAQTPQFDGALRASVALQQAAGIGASHIAVPEPAVITFAAPQSRSERRSLGTTLMIIGGIGIVAGAVTGGSGGAVLLVGGLACAGYGFYVFNQ